MATIRKRGDKWQVQIRRIGFRPIAKSFHLLKDAEIWARQMEVQADRCELPPDPQVLQQITLGQLVERYRDTVSVNKRTHKTERIILNAFLSRKICTKRLSELRTEDFATYRDERLKTIKPSSLKRELAPIHNLFVVAKNEWGLPIRENPLDRLKLSGTDTRRERRLRPGEFDKLIQAAEGCRNSLIGTIIRLAVETGMRRGEILAIKKSHINTENRTLLIPETKNGHPRTIPLTNISLALLQQAPGEGDRLFPMSANAFRLTWERLKRRAGIDDLHFHDLRHEAISRLFELGLTVPEVASMSGHRDMRMLLRYAHAQKECIVRKLEKNFLAKI